MKAKVASLGKKGGRKARRIVQIVFFIIVAVTATGGALNEKGITIPLLPEASLHSICPFGGVVSIWQFLNVGTMVKKVHESSFVLGGIALVLAL
ncbi:MAG: 4Fe-4S binding protein, partial [Spirochaetales bacterium]|nr:4Fe-4S binding protein [Spirochaetales bacterium]